MSTTAQSYHTPALGGSAMNVDHGQRYVSSRRSSSSSSNSLSRPFSAVPQTHMPSSYRNRNGYFACSPADGEESLNIDDRDQMEDRDTRVADQRAFTPTATVAKGKQRAMEHNERPATMFQIGEGRRREYKSDWLIDEAGSVAGADAWVERDRVVLILGCECINPPFLSSH